MTTYRATALSIVVGVLLWVASSPTNATPEPRPPVEQPKAKARVFPLRRADAVGLFNQESAPVEAGRFVEAGPVSPFDGKPVTCDLVPECRKRNITSLGLGCCVFRSLCHSAHYQGDPTLQGIAEWMVQSRIPGGGYPSKVDDLILRIAKDRKASPPAYVQHTGGDATWLELALKTGRYPCVTYAGRDIRYSGPIAHMVNLAHLDDKQAAILDNNFPAPPERAYLWMSRADFLERWKDKGGGWAVCLLTPPPAPVPHN